MAWMRGKLLGAGAFGSVNLAIRRADGEVFAVKSVVVSETSEGAVRAIENEVSVLRELESEYVVRCLGSDWTTEGGHLMRNVFLEYMPEGCLTDFVKQFGSLDEHLLRSYTRSIVQGIDYLHSRGVVHCDVKGKNILVGNGRVKLTDFGSAKRVGDVERTEKVSGTPLWMAPEVVRQVEQGPASDIWSLGCTVVEMATGRAPWSNLAGMNHLVALYHIGCTDELPPVPATLSAEAHDFLSHCFERDPRKRWTSAQLLQHPFLTTTTKAPVSPISVMAFPECESESELSFENSVPTLAAPSLFKRGLVCKEQVEENWWSSPAGPDSGPWIVVRSPKSASSPPSFDSMAPVSDCQEIFAESPMSVNSAAPFLGDASSSSSEDATDNGAAAGFHFCHFAIAEMDFCVAGYFARFSERLRFSTKPDLALNIGFAALIGTINEFSELVYQYSNPQILLYWWHSHRKRLRSGRDFQECTIQFLDEYTLILETTFFSLPLCVCCLPCWRGVSVMWSVKLPVLQTGSRCSLTLNHAVVFSDKYFFCLKPTESIAQYESEPFRES